MTSPVHDDELMAFADGMLDPDREQAVLTWLDAHPQEAERVRLWRAQNAGLSRLLDPVLAEPLPDRLRLPARRRQSWRAWGWQAAAALALILTGALAGWNLRGLTPAATPPTLAAQALAAHATFVSEVRHPVEVPASDQTHLVSWLSKRLGDPLTVPDLASQGFHLVGGRLLPAGTGPAAQFMYENAAGQRLTLYLTRNPEQSETAFRFATQANAAAFYWMDKPFAYALVGNLTRDQLMALTRTVHAQVERRL